MKSFSAIHMSALAAIALLTLLPLASCTNKVDPPTSPGDDPPAGAMRPVIPDSVQSIFTANCAVPGCHVPATAFGGEILDADSSYARIVNIPAVQVPARMRILPGDAANSYLVMKITDDPGIIGLSMPRGSPLLADSLQQRVINWVAAGAPADSIPADSSRLVPGFIPNW
jgi:hypothetical protein